MMRIIALKFAESTIAESQVYAGGDPHRRIPIAFVMYLIRTADRLILVDAGCNTMPGFDMRHFCGPAAILRAAGVESRDITDVVLTHTHHDHIEAVGEYPNAVVYLHQSGAAEAAPYLADRVPVTFEKTLTVCDGVEIRHIGGHSVDSCIVAVQSESGEYVIVGDECYARDCLIDLRPIGSVYDREASNRFLRRYRDANVLLCHENILPDQNGFETVL